MSHIFYCERHIHLTLSVQFSIMNNFAELELLPVMEFFYQLSQVSFR